MAVGAEYANKIMVMASDIVTMMARIEEMIQRSEDDPALLGQAYEAVKDIRKDLTEQDFVDFIGAIQQLLFPYNSGGPPPLRQKIYKLL